MRLCVLNRRETFFFEIEKGSFCRVVMNLKNRQEEFLLRYFRLRYHLISFVPMLIFIFVLKCFSSFFLNSF